MVISCTQDSVVPVYIPLVAIYFNFPSMNHTKDTIDARDKIYLNVVGKMYDMLKVYVCFTNKSSANGSPVYFTGGSSTPIKLTRVFSTYNVSGVNPWTSTMMLTELTSIYDSKPTMGAISITS